MKQYWFSVMFKNGEIRTVQAFNAADAIILAKAEMIKSGFSHDVDEVRQGIANG